MGYFTSWEVISRDMPIFGLLGRVPGVGEVDHWWRNIEAASPFVDSLFAVLFDGFNLAEALESTVVSLV